MKKFIFIFVLLLFIYGCFDLVTIKREDYLVTYTPYTKNYKCFVNIYYKDKSIFIAQTYFDMKSPDQTRKEIEEFVNNIIKNHKILLNNNKTIDKIKN